MLPCLAFPWEDSVSSLAAAECTIGAIQEQGECAVDRVRSLQAWQQRRVAYPAQFKPGGKLGQFADFCRQRVGRADEVMGPIDTGELRALLDFANRYHHDENPAYQTEAINDRELTDFTRRTLVFASRPRQ